MDFLWTSAVKDKNPSMFSAQNWPQENKFPASIVSGIILCMRPAIERQCYNAVRETNVRPLMRVHSELGE